MITNSYSLSQNYPNPFNPSTHINYAVPNDGFVTLKVFDILGREVSTLVDEFKKAGFYEFNYDASKLTSGMYFYKINSRNFSDVKKMVLIK